MLFLIISVSFFVSSRFPVSHILIFLSLSIFNFFLTVPSFSPLSLSYFFNLTNFYTPNCSFVANYFPTYPLNREFFSPFLDTDVLIPSSLTSLLLFIAPFKLFFLWNNFSPPSLFSAYLLPLSLSFLFSGNREKRGLLILAFSVYFGPLNMGKTWTINI